MFSARYCSAISCFRSPAAQKITGTPFAFPHALPGGRTGPPAASGARHPVPHPSPRASAATTPGTRPDYGPAGNRHSARSGPRSHTNRSADPRTAPRNHHPPADRRTAPHLTSGHQPHCPRRGPLLPGEGMPAADHGAVAGAAARLPAGPAGVIGAPVVPAATPAEVLLARPRARLPGAGAGRDGRDGRRTSPSTPACSCGHFRGLGSDPAQQADLAAALGRLTAAEVVTFGSGWASCRSPAYGQAMVYALRNLLRYLHARGLLSQALAEAMPTVPGWKPAHPSAGGDRPADGGAAGLLRTRYSAIGRRDYAIMLLLTRLGLRASEIASITLAQHRLAPGGAAGPREGQHPGRASAAGRFGEAMADYLRRGHVVATARTCSCGPKHRSPAWRGPGSPRWCSALAGGRVCPRLGRTGSATPWPRSCDARAPR